MRHASERDELTRDVYEFENGWILWCENGEAYQEKVAALKLLEVDVELTP